MATILIRITKIVMSWYTLDFSFLFTYFLDLIFFFDNETISSSYFLILSFLFSLFGLSQGRCDIMSHIVSHIYVTRKNIVKLTKRS